MITRRAGQKCEICAAIEDQTDGRRLEAHERWAYDERSGVQVLRRLICLCSPCHLSTHMGYANVTGRGDQALSHLHEVTGMTQSDARSHVDAAGAVWAARSRRSWELDLSMLTAVGITLAQPENPAARADRAQEQLAAARTRNQHHN
jgi:hypothetical protein